MSETNLPNQPGYVQPAQDVIEQINELQDEANILLGRNNPPISQKYRDLLERKS